MAAPKTAPCVACGHECAWTAKTCPNCGRSNPTVTVGTKIGCATVFFIVAGIIGGWMTLGGDDESDDSPAVAQAVPSLPPGQYRIREGMGAWMACTEKETVQEMYDLQDSGDRQAWELAAVPRLLTGECDALEEGEIIYFMETALLDGLIRVRRPGEAKSYWVHTRAREI